ncbi:xanthine dehydrogenase family protein molybdopterin-binding subunit [Actinomycetospora termitidis]|uniref:Xanthine dehydrogenase family protein molybdopterin-binding subunit n=1 Tax=Actinomycetospora termitidis TaxID=3053470 RepID=A0ABT7MFZ3_9PSEU|nr:xanthine dehydrogenase family protein molybdopterin-binding subunit [Actinomycetospora sp. Odt1-22]MDL5159595.1 xanthine dehydrogenase family protein molybdopterin-binding subunit [Actinomycetospora sp. Odt1-22]
MTTMDARSMGTSVRRIEGPDKVTGTAPYAGDTVADGTLVLYPVQATVARGEITAIDTSAATALPGVAAVVTHLDAPRLADDGDPEHRVLQGTTVHHRGQYVAAVLADHAEVAAEAARLVVVSYDEAPSTTGFDPDGGSYTPSALGNGQAPDSVVGDPDAALAAAPVVVKASYATPMEHHNPMEPHATTATWVDGRAIVHEASQGADLARQTLATLFDAEVEVSSPHVGGGFGTKGFLHAGTVLAVLAARTVPGRPVRFALGRRQMFETVGYRPATVQHMALGAEADGRLDALVHDVVGATARYKEFVEPAGGSSRSMYAAPHRRTSHRAVPLDLDAPTYMRAPGEAPGSFGLECAMDELAVALDMDPIELRVRNEPSVHPENGLPFSSRGLVECLRTGAERFGWSTWDRAPRRRLVDGWWHGVGVGCGTFPAFRMPGSTAEITFTGGRYVVAIGAADIGQGARTVLTQIAADALGVDVGSIEVEIGSTSLPVGSIAGGSAGTASWGSTVVEAADRFRDKYGEDPDDGDHADAATPDNPWAEEFAMAAYVAQFAEVAVHADTGEIRVPRLLGTFGVGRILNPTLGRSQLQGGMVWGLSMALHEESVVDPRFGEVINHDLAGYHIAANADVREIDAQWIDEDDGYVNPMGAKGIGEIGIVGVAAAIANATYHATGVRVRSLPITCDDLLTDPAFG